MRSRPRSIGASALVLSGLSATLAGCSSGGTQESFTSASLSQRPEQGMVREQSRSYPDGSSPGSYSNYGNGSAYSNGTYGRPYAQAPRQYVDPGQPTPRQVAAAPYYGGQPGYASSPVQTGSLGPSGDPGLRWQQTPRTQWTQPQPQASAPVPPQQPTHSPNIVEVREGDTLYGLSRRYNVPVGDLVAANRLPSERIAIGQRLVIPTRYR
ncbi:MAG: LysM peptidoglycan-binding domain-containing protein [Hyphomicrobium zavarzinii]|jgi:hypothetical protein|uniref:LysM peptidoglycan-binding domain-containing protein n=1 Tax=Hyphomicrobium zavarzinii TaxID=48292 RepID=UPI001A430702|nr:LysM peptidoglycan-binding domain-containing protein [Hyphomicrobium zavarzinii]MBL8845151.1 LysM peptidoglycan-binding domain-containing protein [Hyphomicrobium zavarzinii]